MSEIKEAIEYIRKNYSKSRIRYILISLDIIYVLSTFLTYIVELFIKLCKGLSFLICGATPVVMAVKYSHKIEEIYELIKTWPP